MDKKTHSTNQTNQISCIHFVTLIYIKMQKKKKSKIKNQIGGKTQLEKCKLENKKCDMEFTFSINFIIEHLQTVINSKKLI